MLCCFVALLLFVIGNNLCNANNIELTDSETESRNMLLNSIPVGSSAKKGKALLEKNNSQCFQASDTDYLNNEKFNYIYCISPNVSGLNSVNERWQIILYHKNDVVKGIKVKYEHLD